MVAFRPDRVPTLMPLEALGRGLQASLAAHRCYRNAARAVDWLDGIRNIERHRRCGRQFSKFDWLPT